MNELLALAKSHPMALALVAYWALSAVVSGMPAPTLASGVGYRWTYQSLHMLAGDLSDYVRQVPKA